MIDHLCIHSGVRTNVTFRSLLIRIYVRNPAQTQIGLRYQGLGEKKEYTLEAFCKKKWCCHY